MRPSILFFASTVCAQLPDGCFSFATTISVNSLSFITQTKYYVSSAGSAIYETLTIPPFSIPGSACASTGITCSYTKSVVYEVYGPNSGEMITMTSNTSGCDVEVTGFSCALVYPIGSTSSFIYSVTSTGISLGIKEFGISSYRAHYLQLSQDMPHASH